ncbi:MAG: MotA/TolQ/ExbB proton channel family protein [Candidatus Brocadiae bacterium]|nr:MotA/TolQ/ExbB proton channel family protein [Candidatus Brocadiia bacterium]
MLDLTTVIGLAIGVAAIVLGVVDAGGQGQLFFNLGALGITIGGAGGATVTQFPWKDLGEFPRVLGKLIWYRPADFAGIVRDFTRYAEVARKDGILALEGVAEEIRDPFVVRGLQLAIDGTDPDMIEKMMTTELEAVAARHELGRKFFETLALFFPAFGLVGTLTGMITMLANLSDPAKVGPGMSQALCATLYGTAGCYMFANPFAKKLEIRSRDELLAREMVIRGILAIQSGDNPRIVEQKLKIYLPAALRADMERAAA